MKIKVLIGLGISLLFIYFSFWKPDFDTVFSGTVIDGIFGNPRIDVKEMLIAFSHARFFYIILVIGMIYFAWWVRAWRWQVLVSPVKKVSAQLSFSAMMIGYLGNNIFPLRAGEFMRMYVAAKRGEMSMSSSLAVIVVERVLDMLMLLMMFTLSLLLFPLPGLFRKAGILILIGTLCFTAFLILLVVQKDKAMSIASWFLKIAPALIKEKFLKIISDFSDGLEIFRRSERYLLVLGWTFFMWFVYVLIIYTSLFVFDFIQPEYPLIYQAPWITAIVMLTVTTAGISIPSAPGAVGTYHGICLFGMELFHVPSELGMSYAILMHLANFFPMTLIGTYCLIKEGIKLTELSGAAKKAAKSE